MSEGEVWKDVVGFEGFYKVSNKGNVYSVERLNSRGYRCGARILKPRYDKDGYLIVGLYINGVGKKKRVHRLVTEAFVPNPNNFSQVNHLDENKANNELSNLEWCDSRYNINYGTRNEKISKKVRAINVETGEVLTFESTQEAGRKGYDQASVSAACRGDYKWGSTGKLIGDGRTYKEHKWYYQEEK